MSNEEIAWAAGLFDGEGCVTTKWPKRVQVVLEIQMAHKPTLERFASIVGGKVNKSYEHRRARRTQWRWKVYDNEAIRIACLIRPFCCEKQDQLTNLVEFKKSKKDEERDFYSNLIKDAKQVEFT